MNSELLTLLLEYKNKLFDDDFIYEAANILYNEKDYTSVLNEIKIYDKIDDEKEVIMCFIREDDELAVSFDDCMIQTEDSYLYLPDASKNEQIFLANTALLHVLMHEFIHIDQELIELDENDDSFEKKLCFTTDAFLIVSEQNKYKEYLINSGISKRLLKKICDYVYDLASKKENYIISPTERLAQIKAYKKLFSTIRPLRDEYKLAYNFFIREYFFEYFNGYDSDIYDINTNTIQGPTSRYFENMKLDVFFDDLKEYLSKHKEISTLDNRLLYGLEINTSEARDISSKYLKQCEKCKRLGIK